MKVLVVGQFDPCCYHLRHRKYLAPHGIDIRLAVERVYWDEGNAADYVLGRADDAERCLEFARQADVIQFSPYLDQEWSYQTTEPQQGNDIDDRRFGPIDWSSSEFKALRVACVHGSVNAYANAERYAAYYRAKGYRLAATTLDYVVRMDCEYLPAIVDVVGKAAATKGRIKVIHTPTNRFACHTAEFLAEASAKHVRVDVVMGKTHSEVVRLKEQYRVGYDNMRGSFAINSLENAALGIANLVGVRPECRRKLLELHGVTLPWSQVETVTEAVDWARRLSDSHSLTREYQEKSHAWFWDEWHPEKVAVRVRDAYQRLAN